MAEIHVAEPARAWQRLHALAGDSARLLPRSFELAAAELLGLPPLLAGQVSGDLPVVGAVVQDGAGAPVIVVGIHVRSGREVVAALTTGNSPTHQTLPATEAGLTILAVRGAPAGALALGVVKNTLLVATDAEALRRHGNYVARTLPLQPDRSGLVVVKAERELVAALATGVKQWWSEARSRLAAADLQNRQRHGGRAPDFGDPAAALLGIDRSVEALEAVLRSTQALRVVAEPQQDRLEVRLELQPAARGAAAEFVDSLDVGDVQPLGELPRQLDAAVLTRATAATRVRAAASTVAGLGHLFGDRLSAEERGRLEEVVGALYRGRGDHAAYGLRRQPEGFVLLFRAPVAEAAAFDDGLRGALRLLNVRAFAEPLRQFVGDVTVKQDRITIEGLSGQVRRARLSIKPAPARLVSGVPRDMNLAPPPMELLWWQSKGQAYAAAGETVTPALVDLATCATSPGASLEAVPGLEAMIARAGKQVAYALLLDLRVTGFAAGSEPAFGFLTAGKREHRFELRLELGRSAVVALLAGIAG